MLNVVIGSWFNPHASFSHKQPVALDINFKLYFDEVRHHCQETVSLFRNTGFQEIDFSWAESFSSNMTIKFYIGAHIFLQFLQIFFSSGVKYVDWWFFIDWEFVYKHVIDIKCWHSLLPCPIVICGELWISV